MKAKLLKTKIPVVIRPIVPWTCFPACARPEHLPNKKKRFDAEVRALWYIGLSTYAAIVVEGRRLVVPIGFLENSYKVNDIFDNAEENFLRTPSDIGRYGKEDFAEDLLLMTGNFDIKIHSVTITKYGADVTCGFKWEVNGHVKPVTRMTRNILIKEDTEEIICY